ncbi:M23 family metallopeptidase [Bermanella marisrubri]|uniref:Peptidase M23B n=1 Tax=Bermanella marisrubri TaxID=207949 RepID=Q1N4W0_9GAMM|nr:M23 family metallopeptidase [Bermanella marisrubri]EAT13318.1 Peptidase M23B [Oceanobacter sp. RED65] [Bermanella marisrubri]QIZ84078.1 M23 family metallopeptidase [Bermanella marisrubri]
MQAKHANLHSVSTSKFNLKTTQPKEEGKARFLMGLNNRVSKMDKRLHRVEAHLSIMYKQQITMKHLALTLVLALLCFTSAALAIREFMPLQISIPATSISETEVKQTEQLESFYSWPLEKTKNLQDVEYNRVGKGIYIQTKLGDPVVAVADGEIIYSGKGIQHLGNLILVKHKDNLITVYGNNYSNYVKQGHKVKAGDLIAAAGERKGRKSGLYFEVRHNGEAQDPFLYLKN